MRPSPAATLDQNSDAQHTTREAPVRLWPLYSWPAVPPGDDPAWRGPALLLPPSVETAQRPPTLDIALSGANCRESSVYGFGRLRKRSYGWAVAGGEFVATLTSDDFRLSADIPTEYRLERPMYSSSESLTGQGWQVTVDDRWLGGTGSGWIVGFADTGSQSAALWNDLKYGLGIRVVR